jgi:hypothetical protein
MRCVTGALAAVLAVSAGEVSTPPAGLLERMPLVGGLLSERLSGTSAKAPPEAVDPGLIAGLVDQGLLSDHPCDWWIGLEGDE